MALAQKKQRDHSRRRFEERYDLKMDRTSLRQLEGRIRANDGIKIDHREYREKWLLWFRDQHIILIYDRQTKRVVTVYPKTALPLHPISWCGYLIKYSREILAKYERKEFTSIWKNLSVEYIRVEVLDLIVLVGYDLRGKILVRYIPPKNTTNNLSDHTSSDQCPASLQLQDHFLFHCDFLFGLSDLENPAQPEQSEILDSTLNPFLSSNGC